MKATKCRPNTDINRSPDRRGSYIDINICIYTHVHRYGTLRVSGRSELNWGKFRYFDKNFGQLSYLKLMKELFIQVSDWIGACVCMFCKLDRTAISYILPNEVFGTPRNHPKSKPFHDHIMCFYWLCTKSCPLGSCALF